MIHQQESKKLAKTGAVNDMKAKEAAEIIKRKNEDFVIIDCLEFDDFFLLH